MKLKNILIVVKDIEKSKQFYHDLFGLDTILDNDGNMILTEGLVLQDEKIWKKFLEKDIIPKNNSCELYFEERVNIDFMHATIEGNTIYLHGVSDSPVVVESALQVIRSQMPEYEAKSAVSIIHDLKNY